MSLILPTYSRNYFLCYHDRSPVCMQCTLVLYSGIVPQVSIWFPENKRQPIDWLQQVGMWFKWRFLQIYTCLDKCKAIPTLRLGHTAQKGSASRDYTLQCDRPSYLLRVMRGRFCHSALAQSHMARSTYWACCWLWNQLLTWFTEYDCLTSQACFFFPGSGINFCLDWQTVSEGRWALHATTRRP